jgi:hypothetical protein
LSTIASTSAGMRRAGAACASHVVRAGCVRVLRLGGEI